MDEKRIIKQIMEEEGITQKELSKRLGLRSQSSITAYLRTDSMKVDKLVGMLRAMGYELVIRGKRKEWEVQE